jgi:hypothetical protein
VRLYDVGDRVVIEDPLSKYHGDEGAVLAVHEDSPAARSAGCEILDVALDSGEVIITTAHAVTAS